MKKAAIIILLILMAALLVFQYLYKDRIEQKTIIPEKKEVNLEGGVALPPEAGNISRIISSEQSVTSREPKRDDKNEPVPEHIAGCTQNSVPSILADYGIVWGDNPKGYVNKRKYVFSANEVIRIKDLLARYYACRAVVSGSDSVCNELPHYGDSKSTSMSEYCKDYYTYASFAAFMSGKAKDQFACHNYWERIKKYTPKELKENFFCQAAANGLPKLCDSLSGQGLDHLRGLCLNVFPKSPEGCVNSPIKNLTSVSSVDCKRLYSLYNGINRSDPSACPSEYEEICSAIVSNHDGVCTKLKDKLVITYCDIYKKVQTAEQDYWNKELGKSKIAGKNKKKQENQEEVELGE